MARTLTEQIPLDFKAPGFELPEPLTGISKTLDEVKGQHATVVMFICNHCPYVVHVRDELIRMGNDYMPKGVGFVAISSNDVKNYPEDHPDLMAELAARSHMPFPYLYDESQQVAKDYHAACTPDLAIFDGDLSCVYRGQLDDSRPGNGLPVNGADMRNALDAILSGSEVSSHQIPSVGCNIKWKS